MSIFSGFNKLNNRINEVYSSARGGLQKIDEITAGVGRAATQAGDILSGNNQIFNRLPGDVNNTIGGVKDAVNRVNGLINTGRGVAGDVAGAVRMTQAAAQGVGPGAVGPQKTVTQATVKSKPTASFTQDWRVSISVPPSIMGGPVLAPLAGDGTVGPRMIFPFTPTVLIGHSANYSNIHPTHTNYAYHAYENSVVNDYSITGEFVNENENDARYWIACLHFLRTVTKMFYGGSSDHVGNPPPVCRLNGYGMHVLNNIPVLIHNFTTDLPSDVDYISCTVDGKMNFVPTQVMVTVTCTPNYARRTQARFSLQDFAAGKHAGGIEGFI